MRSAAARALLAVALTGVGQDGLFAAPGRRGAAVVPISDREGREVGWYSGSHALLIGNSAYSYGWQSLESIPGEIAQVKKVLMEHGFQVEEVKNATGDQLSRAFKDFVDRHGYEQDNRLLFYFAGHGYTRDNRGKAYLVPVDAPQPDMDQRGFLARALPLADIERWAEKVEAKHALFLFDSCFSGAIFKVRSSLETPPHITAHLMKPVRQFITSGSAFETVPAQSVFSSLLVKALHGAGDLDQDGYVTGTELGIYLHREVRARRVGQTPQFGKIRDPDLDEGDFVFVLASRDKAPLAGEQPAADSEPANRQNPREPASLPAAHADLPMAAEQTELEVVSFDGSSILLSGPSIAYPSTFGPSKLIEGIRVRRGVEESTLLWSGLRLLKFRSRQEKNDKGTTVWRHEVEATLASGRVVDVELEDDWNMAYMGGGGTGLLFGQTDLGEVRIPFSSIAVLRVLKYAPPAN
jgi:hypothetical protein